MATIWNNLEFLASRGDIAVDASTISPTKKMAESMSKSADEDIDKPTKMINDKLKQKDGVKDIKTTKIAKQMSKTPGKNGQLSASGNKNGRSRF